MNDTQVIPTIRLNPGSKAADFQTANDTLRNLGGGFIELTPGAAYKPGGGFIIDTGAGVGIKGNGAVFDFTDMTSGTAINCNARKRNPDNFPVPGYDGATTMVVDYIGSAIHSSATTMSGTDWQKCYLNSMSAREQFPAEWATHVHFRFNMDSVANNGGYIYFDDFYVTVY